MRGPLTPGKRQPANDEADPADGRQRPEETRPVEREQIQTSGEQGNTRSERNARHPQSSRRLPSCEHTGEHERARVNELIEHGRIPGLLAVSIEHVGKGMGAEGAQQNAGSPEEGAGDQAGLGSAGRREGLRRLRPV